MKKDIISKIENKDSITARVFLNCILDWENSSSVSRKLFPDRKPDKSKSTNVPIVYQAFKEIQKGGFLDCRVIRKGNENKYVGARPYYTANSKAFLDFFRSRYNYVPSKSALKFITQLLSIDFYRNAFVVGYKFPGKMQEIAGDFYRWAYNLNLSIFENFRDFIKYQLLHSGTLNHLDITDKEKEQVEKVTLAWRKKIEIKKLPKEFNEPLLVADLNQLFNSDPEAYLDIVKGLFWDFFNRKIFQYALQNRLLLIRARGGNPAKESINTFLLYNNIKAEN